MATEKKSKKKGGKTKEPKEPKPKQQRLPGTEDAKIDRLEDLAEEYADVREEGFAQLKKLKDIEKEILEAMKEAGKMVYKRNGITIRRTEQSEKVKVRVKKDGDESGE